MRAVRIFFWIMFAAACAAGCFFIAGLIRGPEKTVVLRELGSGDARFVNASVVAAALDGGLVFVSDGEVTQTPVRADWLDCPAPEPVVVATNASGEAVALEIDPSGEEVTESLPDIIPKDGRIRIDPDIVRTDSGWLLSLTRIEGAANNADPEKENGTYTVELYSSPDLRSWTLVSEALEAPGNIEEPKLGVMGDDLVLVYEREVRDKASSKIEAVRSSDGGCHWSPPAVLVDDGADNEIGAVFFSEDGLRLYYSSDAGNGGSYSGARAFAAGFGKDFREVWKKPVDLAAGTAVLLYDVLEDRRARTVSFLYSRDYLGDNDLYIQTLPAQENGGV